MTKFNYAIIMAAGRGMRMMPLTGSVPKAMAPFNGTTLIGNGIENLKKYIDNIYITVGYKGSELAGHVIHHQVSGIFNTSGRENSWWLFHTLMKFVDEPIVVLTCDNVINLEFGLLLQEYVSFQSPACMLVPVAPVPGLEGDYIFHENNRVTKLSRREPNATYCSGIQIINPKRVNDLIGNASDFYEVWQKLTEKNQLFCGNVYPKSWFTADTVAQLASLNNDGARL